MSFIINIWHAVSDFLRVADLSDKELLLISGSPIMMSWGLLVAFLLPVALRADLRRLPLRSPSSSSSPPPSSSPEDSFQIKRTSIFKFIGRPGRHDAVNASAVVLSGHDVCAPTQRVVVGKIILTVWTELTAWCTMDEAYTALDDRGARALVLVIGGGHSGVMCYWHLSWDPYALSGRSML